MTGDYYFGQGKFDHAVNWYERALRKEDLKAQKDRQEILEHEETVSKLKSTLIAMMENHISKVNQILGFGEMKDLKSLFANPKLFLKDVGDMIDGEQKDKLREAKEQLTKFNNIFYNYRNLLEERPIYKDMNNLISLSFFFAGVIGETENHFVLADTAYEKALITHPKISPQINERKNEILPNIADEYFYQSPLNWVKSKELFKIQIDNGNIKNPDLFVKLAFIHSKFNNFIVSLDYFKKAYDLLKDAELEKNIGRSKIKKTFIYPDDIGLIPQKLIKKYPFLQAITFYEIRNLLNMLGIDVTSRSDGFIGKTGIKSPVDIIIRSAGALVGNYTQIIINGNNVSQDRRGYNIVVLNSNNGKVEISKHFDTHASKDEVEKMKDFINGIAKGKIVCVAVRDEASRALSKGDGEILREIGSKENLYGKHRWAHGIIGVKGSGSGDAIEVTSEKPIEIYVFNKGGQKLPC